MSSDSIPSEVRYKVLDFLGHPRYRVGDDGSVWSSCNGKWGTGKWKRMIPQQSSARCAHLYVGLSNGKGRQKQRAVHRLVLMAFVGPCPEGMQCCHDDGNPANNRLENLRWDTQESNQADRVRHGTSNRGIRCGKSKLTEEQVRRLKMLRQTESWTYQQLGDYFNVSMQSAWGIVNGQYWSWLT